MKTSAIISALAATALSAQIRPRQLPRLGLKPLAADTIAGCDAQIPATEIDDCETVAAKGGLSAAQFLTYNPSVGADCSNFTPGQAYCLHVPQSLMPKASELKTPLPMKGKAVPQGKAYAPPSNCSQFQKIFPDDVADKKRTCDFLARIWAGSSAEAIKKEDWLRALNPGLEPGCANLEVGAQLCVRVPKGTAKQGSRVR